MSQTSQVNKKPFLLDSFEKLEPLVLDTENSCYFRAKNVTGMVAFFVSEKAAIAWLEDSRSSNAR